MVLRESSAVCQIELPSLIFFGKNAKILLQQLAKDLAIFGNLGKTSLQRINLHASTLDIIVS
jgi:hypothetical protein